MVTRHSVDVHDESNAQKVGTKGCCERSGRVEWFTCLALRVQFESEWQKRCSKVFTFEKERLTREAQGTEHTPGMHTARSFEGIGKGQC